MPSIFAKSSHRFATNNLCVATEVMGKSHEFEFEGLTVRIQLPTQDEAEKDQDNEVAQIQGRKTETNLIVSFHILSVDLFVSLPNRINVPEKALTLPPKQIEHFTQEEISALDSITESHSQIAERAFTHWLQILRWCSDNPLIGLPKVEGSDSGGGARILESSSNKCVWIGTVWFLADLYDAMDCEQWEVAQVRLVNGRSIPLHLHFLHLARQSFRNGEFEKSILETALSCEVYIRYSVFEFMPEDLSEEMTAYIEEANINQYVSRFFHSLVPNDQLSAYKKLKKDINSLMSKRNSYVHMGSMNGATPENCKRFIRCAKELSQILLRDDI